MEYQKKRRRRAPIKEVETTNPVVETTSTVIPEEQERRKGVVIINHGLLSRKVNDPKLIILDLTAKEPTLLYHSIMNEPNTKVQNLIVGSEVEFSQTSSYEENFTICDVFPTGNKLELFDYSEIPTAESWTFPRIQQEWVKSEKTKKDPPFEVHFVFYHPKDKDQESPLFLVTKKAKWNSSDGV